MTGFSCNLKSMKRENSAQLIQRRRDELGLTQQELADRVVALLGPDESLTYQAVQGWENGETAPKPKYRPALETILKVDISLIHAAVQLTAEQRERRRKESGEYAGVERRWHKKPVPEERRRVPLLTLDESPRKGRSTKKRASP